MKELRQTTIETYNQKARELSEYFRGIGSREDNIDYVLDLLGNPTEPRIIEIGCGDGRDAGEIVKRTPNYLGFDISTKLIDIAKQTVPGGNFVVADAADFEFPDNIDAIFAFASLLHLDQDEIREIMEKAHKVLKPSGIFYISTKHAPEYSVQLVKDRFGERLFYFYNDNHLIELAGEGFEVVASEVETKGNTDWVEMALRKI